MLVVQAKKVLELESYGWVMNDPEVDTHKLLNGLPVTMRNLRRDLALVYNDGNMRAVEYHPTLCRQEDFRYNGQVKPQADKDAVEHLRDIVVRIFGGLI